MANLTQAQRTTLANHIKANVNQEVVSALAIRNDTELARLYNLNSSFYVWREAILPEEYREAMDWTEVDNLSVGKARIWEWITQNFTMNINASKQNIRAGLNNAFNNTTTKTNLLAIAVEQASAFEEVFSSGTGTQGSPGVRAVQGPVDIDNIGRALNENP